MSLAILPGLAISAGLALAAVLLRELTAIKALNPVVVALVLGIAVRAFLGSPANLKTGVAFAVRPVLRAAIVLLGLQVTLGQLLSIGPGALALALAAVALTMPFTIWLGDRLGVSPALSQLIGTGTGICGASAIVAANEVAGGDREDVAYALAVVTLFGTLALVLYPSIGAALEMSPRVLGLWTGSSIHEVVQAVGAAAAGGPQAAETGTITKLARVVLLAPAIIALGLWLKRGEKTGKVKVAVPWFAFGFLGMVGLGSTGLLPPAATALSQQAVPLMMATAVAALGLGTDLKALKARGPRPLMLGGLATLFIGVLGIVGAHLV
jgi:uncharacterized integral membrane protein (TIGR00698 family)